MEMRAVSRREKFSDVSACMMRLCIDMREVLMRIADGRRIMPCRENDNAIFFGERESGVVMTRVSSDDDSAVISR
jgi:hypothetical protein